MRRRAVCLGLIGAFLFGIALSDLPQLHERLHPGANQPQHECAVTLIATGKCDHHAPPPVSVRPNLTPRIPVAVTFEPIWVASPFLSARIFEHAPPVLA